MLPTGILQTANQRDLLQRQNASPLFEVGNKKILSDRYFKFNSVPQIPWPEDFLDGCHAKWAIHSLKGAWAGTFLELYPLSSLLQPDAFLIRINKSELNLPIGSTTGAGAGADLFQGPDDLSTAPPPPVSSQLSPGSSLFSLSSSSFSLEERNDL